MGTRGLRIVRFRKRYYVRYNQYDSYYEGLGADIVGSIPADPEEYKAWLSSQRERYAALEKELEEGVYELHKDTLPEYSLLGEYIILPTELPRLDCYNAEFFYIINLDEEVLTMNYSIHWKLDNIPRENEQWLKAITNSIYKWRPTINPDLCPEEHMGCPAVPRIPRNTMPYEFAQVNADTKITAAHEVFRARMAAGVFAEYHTEIERFGLEWTPDSLVFREMVYAIVSLAAGDDNSRFYSFPSRKCNPRSCRMWHCEEPHFSTTTGYLTAEWVGERAPLYQFASSSHFPGMPAGAAPVETTYWLGDVAVHLSVTVDNGSISDVVTWGWEQGRRHFQAVVISIFEVAFAEVSPRDTADGNCEPFVRVSESHELSPLTEQDCDSSHPRERPIRSSSPSEKAVYSPGQRFFHIYEDQIHYGVLESRFPGIAALVKFFDVAAARRTAVKAERSSVGFGKLPVELYRQIMFHADYDTWKALLSVSPTFREEGLARYRVDDRFRIVAGPFKRANRFDKSSALIGFDFQDLHTGAVMPMTEKPRKYRITEWNWVPLLGRNGRRQELVVDVFVQFEPFDETVEGGEEEVQVEVEERDSD